MLTFEKFSKSYNQQLIIEVGELHLTPGIYWVRGENGSGKSTLFKSLAGLLPFHGDIRFNDNVSITKQPIEFRKRISYSEAEPVFPGFLTSKDLARFVGSIRNAEESQIHEVINKLGVKSYFENPCETYSSGMMKKLSLALAFLGQPQVLILDEPLITLDETSRQALLSMVLQFSESGNKIILMSSHQSQELNELKFTKVFKIQDKKLTDA